MAQLCDKKLVRFSKEVQAFLSFYYNIYLYIPIKLTRGSRGQSVVYYSALLIFALLHVISVLILQACGSRGQSVDTTTGIARIINGFDADAGAWPWQIALEVFG